VIVDGGPVSPGFAKIIQRRRLLEKCSRSGKGAK